MFTMEDASTGAGGYGSLALPAQPVARLVGFKQKFQCTGVPPHAAELMEALHIGYVQLAQKIIEINNDYTEFDNGPSKADAASETLLLVTNILLSRSSHTIQHAIRGRLHITHQSNPSHEFRIPAQHYLTLPSSSSKPQERPVIYILVLCGRGGVAFTKAEIMTILDKMEIYAKGYRNEIDYKVADQLAGNIDRSSLGTGRIC